MKMTKCSFCGVTGKVHAFGCRLYKPPSAFFIEKGEVIHDSGCATNADPRDYGHMGCTCGADKWFANRTAHKEALKTMGDFHKKWKQCVEKDKSIDTFENWATEVKRAIEARGEQIRISNSGRKLFQEGYKQAKRETLNKIKYWTNGRNVTKETLRQFINKLKKEI